MNPISRPNTPVPELRLDRIRNSYECDTCGRLARSYIAMTVKDRQTKYYCTHHCFRTRTDGEMCYICHKISDVGQRINAGGGQVYLCSKDCESAYEVEIFN